MASMDVFKSSAFSMTSLTGLVDKIDFKPQLLGDLGIFEPMPVRTRDVWVEQRGHSLTLVPTSQLGAPPEELDKDKRSAVPFRATRLAKGVTMYAHEVDGIRAFGAETELQAVQTEYLRRAAQNRMDIELTEEHHRLGALQGVLLDADGTTVIYDYFDAFGIVEAAAVSFELDVTTTNVRKICKDLVRAVARASKGAWLPGTRLGALCGGDFYDALVHHPNVEKFYLNWQQAAELRGTGTAFGSFEFEGIVFYDYRGTDDGSTVAIAANEAKFFPIGARDVFKKAMAPAEFGPFVNTLGRPIYSLNLVDPSGREAWVRNEQYAYPLYLCQRPDMLRKATLT